MTPAHLPQRERPILLVVMPFASIRPAIGVSLLKALLNKHGIEAHVLYLNMHFANEVGFDDFNYVAELAPSQSIAGDWVFAEALRGSRPKLDVDYLAIYPGRFKHHRDATKAPEILKRCRARARPFLERSLGSIDWSIYSLIGFTSTFAQHAASLALAKLIKEQHPEVLTALGGANCEGAMGLATHEAFSFMDFVFSGEADLAFPECVVRLREGKSIADIRGLISRQDGKSYCASLTPDKIRSLDDLPTPDYRDYFDQLRALGHANSYRRVVLMESSRGCWWGEKHHCTFCGLNGMAMAFRSKSSERVIGEMRELVATYRPETIEMVDNILDMQYFGSVLPELASAPPGPKLFYETKANLRRDQVQLLKAAGVETIQPGIESLDANVLKIMRKGTSPIQNIRLLKWCKEFGIKPYWNLLYGFPGEHPSDYAAMRQTMRALHHLEPPHGTGAIRLDRFSPNFEEAGDLGFVNVRPDRSYAYVYGLNASSLERMAYFFEHDYADRRDPELYAEDVRAAVMEWHRDSGTRGLVQVDHGDLLAIWDLRPGAKQRLAILEGVERELYLYCEGGRSSEEIDAFATRLGAPCETQTLVGQWVEARLMLLVDGRYLSLAVNEPSGDPRSEPADEGNNENEVAVLDEAPLG